MMHGFRLSPWAWSLLIAGEKLRLNEKLEMRNGGAAHKNQKRRGA